MTMPLMKPKRKNPVLRTRQMNLPPWARGRVALGLTAAAAEGRFELQVCQRLQRGAVPAARGLPPLPVAAAEVARAVAARARCWRRRTLHHSNDLFFRERLPWRLGLVQLDCRPDGDRASARRGAARRRRAVRVGARLDRAGQAVLIGFPERGE